MPSSAPYIFIQYRPITSRLWKSQPITARIPAPWTSFGNGSFWCQELIDTNLDESARRTARIPLRAQPMKNKRGGAFVRSMNRVDLGFKKKTRVNSRGCGKSKRLLKVYLSSILSGKLTYQWHLRKDTHHSIRKVACCQLKLTLNVAAEAKLRMESHASGLVLYS